MTRSPKATQGAGAASVSLHAPQTAGSETLLTEYVVAPEGFDKSTTVNRHLWTVRVRRADLMSDRWMVVSFSGQHAWTLYGELVQMSRLSRRQVRHWCEMPLKEAHKLACRAVATLKVDGRTLSEEDAVVVRLCDAARRNGELMDNQRRRRHDTDDELAPAC